MKVEVCFSPVMYPYFENKQANVVIVDILRASSSICAAFMNGVDAIIPVGSRDEAIQYKSKGYTVAAERDGIVLDFADFGNSPANFTKERVSGKSIVYSTTNGTKAIQMTKDCHRVLIGSFLNLQALAEFLIKDARDVLIFCAGWKNKFNIEDTLFAGALAELLLLDQDFNADCDSVTASLDLWSLAKNNLMEYTCKLAWRKRLGMDDVREDCMRINTTDLVPLLSGDKLII